MKEKIAKIYLKTLEELDKCQTENKYNKLWLNTFGKKGSFTSLFKTLKNVKKSEKAKYGKLLNKKKKDIEIQFKKAHKKIQKQSSLKKIDTTIPGTKYQIGHLHIVTQAIEEITRIFEKIGFSLVRYKEVEWDYYAFSSLNFPDDHPARDDFETFFIEAPISKKFGKMLLTPHTSSGQVREMERLEATPPIRMINISKCYRPNWDISHTPMFHQFEGLVIDQDINITHLKGTMDYFAREFFGKKRKTRLRPFHFQFTEPSFEVDINCAVCKGTGRVKKGKCKYCKEGWMELGGSGLVHPEVLKAGNIDPKKYTGFAFGWGVERTFMMKSGTRLDDNRLLYTNDVRFLKQF